MRSLSEINLDDIDVKEYATKIIDAFNKTTKKQRILFVVIIILLISGYLFGKNLWQKYSILKQAKNITSKITQTQKDFFLKYKAYRKDVFIDNELRNSLNIYYGLSDSEEDFMTSGRINRRNNFDRNDYSEEDYTIAQSGDFYIENDAENGCVVLKYKRNTPEKTTFYASFTDNKIYCQGKKCLKETKNNEVDLCYKDGVCFSIRQLQKTERTCGGGNGLQTRKCKASCENGTCEKWSECVCKKGFEWTGNTCKQSQTEKDCTEEQCFNGVYCENKEILEKTIEGGTCTRIASCQKNSGWEYSAWNCSCENEDYCSLEEQCVLRPQDSAEITLPNEEDSCSDISYECRNGRGWVALAKNCVCDKIGFFWDEENKEAKCSECTNKPDGAIYTSAGKNKNDCSWKCDDGYQLRKGTCAKPNGQYLCARTELSICTDEFSKNRKIQKDAKKTNEGQLCYVEDKDNVLFYNQKEKTCQVCQCVDLVSGKTSH